MHEKIFETINDMKKYLFENGIDISFFDLSSAIESGYLFTNDYDFECYFDDFKNEYVLKG